MILTPSHMGVCIYIKYKYIKVILKYKCIKDIR